MEFLHMRVRFDCWRRFEFLFQKLHRKTLYNLSRKGGVLHQETAAARFPGESSVMRGNGLLVEFWGVDGMALGASRAAVTS
jgi:hypothetical protein